MFGMMLIGLYVSLSAALISPPVWMILIGLGLYLGYVPFNSIFFDRLIADFSICRHRRFYDVRCFDSFGYLGSVAVLFFKEFGYAKLSWLNFLFRRATLFRWPARS